MFARGAIRLASAWFALAAMACGEGREEPTAASRCLPPPGTSGQPRTIAGVLTLANALERPLSLACLLESLERPLQLEATRSQISLQPAVGRRSPRIFLFLGDKLTLSVVPDGDGRAFLELGEFVDDWLTLKGELAFPVVAPLDEGAPYRHLVRDGRTVCGGCHGQEQPAPPGHPAGAFISEAFRPELSARVPLEMLIAEHETCDGQLEPERCALLTALFAHGPVESRGFPTHLPTIFRR